MVNEHQTDSASARICGKTLVYYANTSYKRIVASTRHYSIPHYTPITSDLDGLLPPNSAKTVYYCGRIESLSLIYIQ